MTWLWILGIVAAGALLGVAAVWIRRTVEIRRFLNGVADFWPTRSKQRGLPCYRCARKATVEYMGLHYCYMCRHVVMMVSASVRHDPPYGFPGSPGYLDFPAELVENKKEDRS